MKNKNDEKRNLMIEFFRRLLKIKEKYEKKKKLVNNNLKIQNVDRDNDEPEILGPEYMVEIWKNEEELLKKKKKNNNNNNIIKIIK